MSQPAEKMAAPKRKVRRLKTPLREITPDRAAKEPSLRPGKLWIMRCGRREGLGVQITPAGTRSWCVTFTNRATGKQEQLVIGRVGRLPWKSKAGDDNSVLRQWEIYAGQATGYAPKSITRKAEEQRTGKHTLHQVNEQYIKLMADPKLSNKPLALGSQTRYRKCTNLLAFAFNATNRDIFTITKKDVLDGFPLLCHIPLERRPKGTRMRGGKAAAYNAMRHFQLLWEFAAKQTDEARPRCPYSVVDKLVVKPAPRSFKIFERFIPVFWHSAARIPHDNGMKAAGPVWALYLRAVLLTGCRLTEMLRVKWSMIDLDAQTITFPAQVRGENEAHTKNRAEHVFPIGKWLAAALRAHKKNHDPAWKDDYVFTYPHGCRYAGLRMSNTKRVVAKHRAMMGKDNYYFIHNLRHSFSSVMVKLDVPFLSEKKMLNHVVKDVTGTYPYIPPDTIRPHTQRVEDWILEQAGVTKEGK
jgi:integrase